MKSKLRFCQVGLDVNPYFQVPAETVGMDISSSTEVYLTPMTTPVSVTWSSLSCGLYSLPQQLQLSMVQDDGFTALLSKHNMLLTCDVCTNFLFYLAFTAIEPEY